MPRYLDGLMPNTSVRIAVPKAWKTLLDIEDFDALARPPEKWRELDSSPASILRHSTSSTPYRDDEREIFHIYGDRHVLLRLHSGDINYWYSIEVFEKKPDEKDFENALAIHVFSDQVSFNIPCRNGDRIEGWFLAYAGNRHREQLKVGPLSGGEEARSKVSTTRICYDNPHFAPTVNNSLVKQIASTDRAT